LRRSSLGAAMPVGMIHMGAIGDLLLAMPVAEVVAGGEPIYLMGRGSHRELAEPWPVCARYADADTYQLSTLLAGAPGERLRRWFRRCGPGPPLLFAASPIAGTRWVNTRDLDGRTHISLQMLRCLRPKAADEDLPLPSLSIPADPFALGGDRPVILHPGSGGVAKCWPLKQFIELAWALTQGGWHVHWLLGPAESERFVDQQLDGEIGEVHCGLPLGVVLSMLAACRGYVGNDSGITHAAAALGRPTVALFGPTRPAVWGPRGRRVACLPFETAAADVARAAGHLCTET
jgi:hypothetical protein